MNGPPYSQKIWRGFNLAQGKNENLGADLIWRSQIFSKFGADLIWRNEKMKIWRGFNLAQLQSRTLMLWTFKKNYA